jgi:hypothetical protein
MRLRSISSARPRIVKTQKPKRQQLDAVELAWFELAHRLHMTVAELKSQITITEFLQWQEFFRMVRDRQEKLHFYLAQIACEVRRSYIKHPRQAKLGDFLLKFANPDEDRPMTPAEIAHKCAVSRASWLAYAGVKPKGLKTPEPPKKIGPLKMAA